MTRYGLIVSTRLARLEEQLCSEPRSRSRRRRHGRPQSLNSFIICWATVSTGQSTRR